MLHATLLYAVQCLHAAAVGTLPTCSCDSKTIKTIVPDYVPTLIAGGMANNIGHSGQETLCGKAARSKAVAFEGDGADGRDPPQDR